MKVPVIKVGRIAGQFAKLDHLILKQLMIKHYQVILEIQ